MIRTKTDLPPALLGDPLSPVGERREPGPPIVPCPRGVVREDNVNAGPGGGRENVKPQPVQDLNERLAAEVEHRPDRIHRQVIVKEPVAGLFREPPGFVSFPLAGGPYR